MLLLTEFVNARGILNSSSASLVTLNLRNEKANNYITLGEEMQRYWALRNKEECYHQFDRTTFIFSVFSELIVSYLGSANC